MNVFQLVIAAVAAGILIYIVMGMFQYSDDKALQELKNGVDYAEQHDGKVNASEIPYKKDFVMNATNFDSPTRNVRLQCSSADTCSKEKMDVQARLMMVKQQVLMDTYFRCVNKQVLNDCVVYFGEMPAQLALQGVVFSEPKQGPGTINFSVTNSGKLDAVGASYSIRVYREGDNEVLVSEVQGQLKKMAAGESQGVSEKIGALPEGKYLLRVVAEGEGSGRDIWEKKFEVASSVSGSCAAGEKGGTTLLDGNCRTQYTCSGCGTGAECSVRWIEKGLSANDITETYSGEIYTERPAVNGTCQ